MAWPRAAARSTTYPSSRNDALRLLSHHSLTSGDLRLQVDALAGGCAGPGLETSFVVHALDGVLPGRDRVAEYFVLEGSPRGLALAKRRLVGLYRAAGLGPREGDAIAPEELRDARWRATPPRRRPPPLGAGDPGAVPF